MTAQQNNLVLVAQGGVFVGRKRTVLGEQVGPSKIMEWVAMKREKGALQGEGFAGCEKKMLVCWFLVPDTEPAREKGRQSRIETS